MKTLHDVLNESEDSDLSYEAKEIVRQAVALAEGDYYYGPAETKVELIFAYLRNIERDGRVKA